MTSYALLAADQNLPTILMEYDYPKVAQWADDGYLATFSMDDFKEGSSYLLCIHGRGWTSDVQHTWR